MHITNNLLYNFRFDMDLENCMNCKVPTYLPTFQYNIDLAQIYNLIKYILEQVCISKFVLINSLYHQSLYIQFLHLTNFIIKNKQNKKKKDYLCIVYNVQ